MTIKEKELVQKLGELFLDGAIGKLEAKFKLTSKEITPEEKSGAWLLKEWQLNQAYPILKELSL